MATTGPFLADNITIKVDGNPVAKARTGTLSMNRDMAETSNKDDSSNKTFIPSWFSATLSGEGLIVFDSTVSAAGISTSLIAGTKVTATYGTGVTGDENWSISGYFNSTELGGNSGDAASISWTIQGTASMTQSTN